MEKNDSFFQGRKTLFSNGKLLSLSKPLVMGIINITKDSFFEGSRFTIKYRIAKRVEQIIRDGGSIIDVGACSTRPGSFSVNEEMELKKLSRAFSVIRKHFPDAVLSVDTFRSGVASRMVKDFGVDMVNDISAGEMDKDMLKTIASLQVPYIVMHMRGTPANMQENPSYENLIQEVFQFFTRKVEELKLLGAKDIILDPGFGFGKNVDHNFTLLKNLNAFKIFELPLMVGISRKSMVYKILNSCPSKALNGTTVLNAIAVLKGASILRVHDVKEAYETIKLIEVYNLQPEYK